MKLTPLNQRLSTALRRPGEMIVLNQDKRGARGPVNTVLPALSGPAIVGQPVTCSTGTWEGAESFAYQWVLNGSDIEGATSLSFTPTSDEIGDQLACRVTASSSSGSTSATSAPMVVQVAVYGPFMDAQSRTRFWVRGTSTDDAEIGFSIDDDASDPEVWLPADEVSRPDALSKAAWKRMRQRASEVIDA